MQKFHAVHSCSVTNIAPGIKCVLAVVLEWIVKGIQYHINCMIYFVFKLYEMLRYTEL